MVLKMYCHKQILLKPGLKNKILLTTLEYGTVKNLIDYSIDYTTDSGSQRLGLVNYYFLIKKASITLVIYLFY